MDSSPKVDVGQVAQAPTVLLGDIDYDGDVDNADIGIAVGSFTGAGSANLTWDDGDVDGDGDVDNADLGMIIGNFTGSLAAPVAAVPEPLTLGLFAFSLTAAGHYWKRRTAADRSV